MRVRREKTSLRLGYRLPLYPSAKGNHGMAIGGKQLGDPWANSCQFRKMEEEKWEKGKQKIMSRIDRCIDNSPTEGLWDIQKRRRD